MSGGSAFPEWAIGVILIIIGSLGNNLGNNLVSLGHQEVRDTRVRTKSQADLIALQSEEEQQHVKLKDADVGDGYKAASEKEGPNWRKIGTIVFVVGNLCTFGAFGFGAQSLIASLESIQFVSNVVFAKYVHKEPITNRMIISTLAILGGNVLVIIFSSHSSDLINSTGMIRLYEENTLYHIYMVLAFVLWAVTSFIFKKYHHSRTVLKQPLLYKHNFLEPFCYAVSSAIIGTQAVLNSKCMSILIQVSARERNEFSRWYIYFILVTWLILVAYWLKRLDWGLELFPPLFIIPVMQVFFVLFAVLCGGIYFEEFHGFTPLAWAGFVSGIALIMGGVYGLAPLDMQLYVPEEEEEENEENGERAAEIGGDVMHGSGSDERLDYGSQRSPDRKSPHQKYEAINSKTLTSKIAKSFPFLDDYFDYFAEVTTSPVRKSGFDSSPSSSAKLKIKSKPEAVVVPILVTSSMPSRGKVYLEPLQQQQPVHVQNESQIQQPPGPQSTSPSTPMTSKKSNRRLVHRNTPGGGSAQSTTPNGSSAQLLMHIHDCTASMDYSSSDPLHHTQSDGLNSSNAQRKESYSSDGAVGVGVAEDKDKDNRRLTTPNSSFQPTRPCTVEDSLVIPYEPYESEPYEDDDHY